MLAQIVANALIAAGVYALLATGFSIIYSTTRFFHFAHGAVFMIAPYVAFAGRQLGLPLLPAIILGIVASVIVGCLLELVIFRSLRSRRAGSLILLLASLGAYVVIQNSVSLFFGDDTKSLRAIAVEHRLALGSVRVTDVQVVTAFTSIVVIAALAAWLRFGRIGKGLRAVADDPELAAGWGLPTDRLVMVAFAIGSGIAGVAGTLVALDVHMRPTMGLHALLMAVVAAIIGGIGSIPGIAAGALLLALAQHFGAWWIGSEWQDAIAFGLLLGFLVFRPEGFFGKPLRTASI